MSKALQDGWVGANEAQETEGCQRPDNGAERISRPMKSKGSSPVLRRNGFSQDGIAKWTAYASAKPAHCPPQEDQRPGKRKSKNCFGYSGEYIPDNRPGLAVPDFITMIASSQLDKAGEGISNTLDKT
jgi:hypothetical protein